MTITKNAATKVAAAAAGLAMALSTLAPVAHAAALTPAQVSSIISLLQSFGADAATIANVQASLTGGTPSGGGSTGGGAACSFTRDLTTGSQGTDVTCLQTWLISKGYSIPAGATGYFGAQTMAAVSAWQKASGITPTAGYFGAKSRAAAAGQGGGNGGSTPITGTGLKVMLASDSPNGTALVQAQAAATLGKFTFQNPTGSSINVTNITFKRIGVSNDATMTNVYLFNGAVRLTDAAGVSNSTFNFNNPSGLFTVPAGGSVTVSVVSDIAGGSAGQQIGVQLTAVSSNGTLDGSVVFPISGGLQAVSAATLSTVDFNTTTLPSSSTVDPQADYTVWQNTVTVGTRAVNLRSFALRQIGSAQAGDITNYRLYVDGTKVGPTVTVKDANDMITFDLSSSPIRLETGGRVLKVVADVTGGASRTFQMSLRYPSDAIFIDTDLNQAVLPTANSSTFSARSATSATINSVSSSAPTVTRSADSPTANVANGASNVKWASFKVLATGEAVKIESLNVTADTSSSGTGLDNGKVFVNGVQVGSTKDIAEFGGSTTNFTFGSSFIVAAGTTATIDIYSDAKIAAGTNLTSGETVKIYLATGSSNAIGQTSLTTINLPTSNVTGNTVTVSSSALSATKASYFGNQSVIAGATAQKVGSFTLSAGSTEGINVNTIEVGFSAGVGNTITNLMLKDHDTGTQVGTTKSTVSTANSFSGSVTVPASGTKTFDIYADVKTGAASNDTIVGTVTTSTTGTGLTTGSSVSVGSTATLQTITVSASTLTVTQNTGSTPDNANIIAGASMVKVGSFRFTTQYSSYTVDKMEVMVPANAATSVASVSIKYKDLAGTEQTATQSLNLSSGVQTHATAVFTGLSFYIGADTNRDVDVYVNVPTVQSGATSGRGINVLLSANEGFNAIDSAGNADTSLATTNVDSSATSGKGTLYVRKSIPTIAAGTAPSSSLTAGTNQVLGRFTVSADAAGDVDWGQVIFSVTKTSAVTIGATTTVAVWDVTGSATQVAGTFATTTGNLTGGLDAFGGASTGGSLHFRPTTVQTISAGSTRTYELRGTVGGLASGSNSISVSIPANTSSASANAAFSSVAGTLGTAGNASFVWSDWSIPTTHASTPTTAADWINDYLVKTLPIDIGTRSVNI